MGQFDMSNTFIMVLDMFHRISTHSYLICRGVCKLADAERIKCYHHVINVQVRS